MVIVIMVITALVSIWALQDRNQLDKLIFYPFHMDDSRQWYRFITHGFIHADWIHLFFNMFVLFTFGSHAEELFKVIKGNQLGQLYFVTFYLAALVAASTPSYLRNRHNPNYRSLGASGAVASVLFFFILFYPLEKLSLMFLPIPIPAFIFGALYLVYEYVMDKRQNTGVAHDAHFWGALFGILFAIVLYPGVIGLFIQQIRVFLHL